MNIHCIHWFVQIAGMAAEGIVTAMTRQTEGSRTVGYVGDERVCSFE